MLHLVHLLERRWPGHAGRIAVVLLTLSACAVLAGAALSFTRA